ncbi:nitroreductase family protein [Deinococcus lacus]|uniref:Nitroreductase family protein n=1 Tax=Deinococcus lacus TaxID=392561 RepID=A0ABW1YCU1_9DEIO
MRHDFATDLRASSGFFSAHRTVRQYATGPGDQPIQLPPDHLETLLYAAQRAPTDATAQLYSVIRITDPEQRARLAALTENAHLATASETFVLCADTRRVARLLEAAGYQPGHWPAVGVHFGVGDAVMAGQNLLIAAEMLGYQGCWVGGVLNNLPAVTQALELPEGVFAFAALTIGIPAEEPPCAPGYRATWLFTPMSTATPTYRSCCAA